MRITAEEKRATRERIVAAALESFRSKGFEATATRDIAQAAGIAAGTLFNYFDTKEAIVLALADEALAKARSLWAKQPGDGSLEEALFALAAAEMRQLKPYRRFLGPLLETLLSPLAVSRNDGTEGSFRGEHLEIVAGVARKHGIELAPTALQVYWALYVGALSFWSGDSSPRQEDTFALLDQSLEMFTAWLRGAAGETL